MIVPAWNNGAWHESGAGYGIRVSAIDRDAYFDKKAAAILLELQGWSRPVRVNTNKASFWGRACRELIKQEIGQLLQQNGLARWPKHDPPKLILQPLGGNRFLLRQDG
jgi:hypothetical protein